MPKNGAESETGCSPTATGLGMVHKQQKLPQKTQKQQITQPTTQKQQELQTQTTEKGLYIQQPRTTVTVTRTTASLDPPDVKEGKAPTAQSVIYIQQQFIFYMSGTKHFFLFFFNILPTVRETVLRVRLRPTPTLKHTTCS